MKKQTKIGKNFQSRRTVSWNSKKINQKSFIITKEDFQTFLQRHRNIKYKLQRPRTEFPKKLINKYFTDSLYVESMPKSKHPVFQATGFFSIILMLFAFCEIEYKYTMLIDIFVGFILFTYVFVLEEDYELDKLVVCLVFLLISLGLEIFWFIKYEDVN